jgi:(p)ppGpp synthase/HD superfamily hydrolase
MLTGRYDRALMLAAAHHRKQTRKGTEIPYLSHLLAVSSLVLENGGSEDEAIAGLLHDAVEDAEDVETLDALRDEIQREFGDAVLEIVEACSDSDARQKRDERALSHEEKMESYYTRKREYIKHLKTAPGPVLIVSVSDKVHNARAIVRDLEIDGRSMFERFNAKEEGTLWYYGRLAEVFASRVADEPRIDWLSQELTRQVEAMHGR